MQINPQLSCFVWLSTISLCLSSGCNNDELSIFRGEVPLRHLPSPGMFGADGYVLRFAPFVVSNAYSVEIAFANLPVRKDPYWIFLVPDQNAMSLDFGAASVSFSLSDADGLPILGVTNKIAEWVESKYHDSPTTIVREFQLARSKSDPESVPFMPKAGGKYMLNISYEPSMALVNKPGTAHFEVRLSAGK